MIAAVTQSRLQCTLIGLALLAATSSARAEPVLDRILSGARLVDKGACAVLKIDFNIRIRYISHFPGDKGNQLSIKIAAIDAAQARDELISRQEAVRPIASKIVSINSIDFEAKFGVAPAVFISFKKPVSFRVAPGKDFQSLIVAMAPEGKTPCAPEWAGSTSTSSGTWETTVSPVELPPAVTDPGEAPAGGKMKDKDREAVTALMDRAREAMGSGDYTVAIRYLTRVLGYPTSEVTREATELLGVAHQRKGEIDAARVQYQEYLRRYPSGDDAKRVRERLASLDTPQVVPVARRGAHETKLGTPGQPGWIVTGSVSQFYLRDDGFRNFVDPSLPQVINKPTDDRNTFQNELLSSLDTTVQWGNADQQSKMRFSGALESGLGDNGTQIFSVATLSSETKVKDWGTLGRFGRQTLNTDGVLGRFDGGYVAWQTLPFLRLDAVVGSPVLRRRDEPFKNGAVFYGAAANFGPLFGAFDTTIYAIEQRTADLVDRQAIGAELRYADETKSAFASIDYDTHFETISAAIVNGTWTLADKSTFTASAEHRSTPSLFEDNALIGQTVFGSLHDMLAVYSPDEIRRFALNSTAFADTASIGFSKPLTEHLQLSIDAAWFSLGGTTGNTTKDFVVDPTAAGGNEYYVSGQLIGTDWLKPSDLYTLGLRYATTPSIDTYVADASARYPVNDKLRVGPRLRLSYRKGGPTAWEEYAAMPSLQLNYQWSKGLGLELESGAKFSQKLQSGTRDTESEFFVTVGYRYDFDAEGAVVKMP